VCVYCHFFTWFQQPGYYQLGQGQWTKPIGTAAVECSFMPLLVISYQRQSVFSPSMHASVRVWTYLTNCLWEFRHIYSWEQRWTDLNLRSKFQRSGSQQDQVWSYKHFSWHYNLCTVGNKDEVITFWGQKVQITARTNAFFRQKHISRWFAIGHHLLVLCYNRWICRELTMLHTLKGQSLIIGHRNYCIWPDCRDGHEM